MLEAHWARCFDALGWKWEYEPFVAWSGWIPDFRLTSIGLPPLYVEVKAVDAFEYLFRDPEIIRAARCSGECILALGPRLWGSWHPQDTLGVYLNSTGFSETVLLEFVSGTKGWESSLAWWRDRDGTTVDIVKGASPHFRERSIPGVVNFQTIWNDCKNAGQWKPRS